MKKIQKLPLILSIISLLTFISPVNAQIKVVASIKPIHSLASYLMDGVDKPDLIVDGYASPHGFALKPSHAKMLQNADLIFWVGEDLESFLEKPLKSIAKKAEKIELMEIKGLNKLEFRERNIFEEHDDHKEHGHKEDKHGHKEDKHGHKEDKHGHKEDKHGHKEDKHDHHEHAHGEHDPHIWLDPMNAKIILSEMTEHLIENDQENASKYKANLKKAHKDLDKLTKKVKSELNKDFKSIVFHDAYQYFEKRFDVNVLGAFTVNTDVLPGAEQLSEIREVIEHEKVSCVFSEPQFNPDIIKAVAKDTNIKTGVIDPLGATLNPGKILYFDLINNMSKSFKGC
jgi:zinc transport system substrate-binding protein